MADSQLNYQQTSYPAEPDTSWEAYGNYVYNGGYFSLPWIARNRAMTSLAAWGAGKSNYETWSNNLMNQYNAQVGMYNDYINSPEGNRLLRENAGYNVNYDPGVSPGASPLNYQIPDPGTGQNEISQGVSGIFQLVNAIMAVKSMGASIAGQELKNEAQEITNRWLDKKLKYGVEGLGYQNDRQQFLLEELFYPRWSKYPELWKGGVYSPYGRGTYDLRDADLGLGYRKQVADIEYIEAGKRLRDSMDALQKASKREKDWYYDNVKEIQKDILTHSRDILKGTYDFQKTEQDLRKWGTIANISLGVVNAAVNTIKAFVPGAGQLIGGLSTHGPKGISVPSSSPEYGSYPDYLSGVLGYE